MGAPRLERARELRDELAGYLERDNAAEVTVTLDIRDVPSASRNGVILITPPALSFQTFTQTEYEWELHVFAGPPGDLEAAWETLDNILEVLRAAGLEMADAKPSTFDPLNNAPAIPGYTFTFTELFID